MANNGFGWLPSMGVTPKNRWFRVENPIKSRWFRGTPIDGNPHINGLLEDGDCCKYNGKYIYQSIGVRKQNTAKPQFFMGKSMVSGWDFLVSQSIEAMDVSKSPCLVWNDNPMDMIVTISAEFTDFNAVFWHGMADEWWWSWHVMKQRKSFWSSKYFWSLTKQGKHVPGGSFRY